jgi:hypothetical protein
MLGLTKTEPEKKEYFFALQIDVGQIKSAVWAVEGDQSQLLSLGKVVSWEKEDEILEKIDTCLSSAVEKLSLGEQDKEPQRIIFGLSSEWVDQNKINPDKAEILKKITQKFELSPMGFVVIPEAITHWLKKIEGVPPNAILIGLNQKKIAVSLIESGRVVNTSLVVRSESLGSDLTEGLSRLGKETSFPARILLYDHEEKLEEARQELISWPWLQEEKISFLHLPKIEILAPDFDIKALVLASASQIAEVKGIEELQGGFKAQTTPIPQTEDSVQEAKEETSPVVEQTTPVLEPVEVDEEVNSIFGFVKNQDVAQLNYPEPTKEEETVVPQQETQNVQESMNQRKLKFSSQFNLPSFKNRLSFFGFLKDLRFGGLLDSLKEAFSRKGTAVLVLTGVILVALLAGLFSLYWFLPKADIVLKVEPQVLEKDFIVKLDPSLQTADRENLILPAQENQTTVSQEKSASSTGTKLVGEKAKGKVIIYNRTSSEKSLAAGTKITGPSNLEFTLDEGVKVASESAGSDYVTIPGKAEVGVTAVKLGSEGNLASGSEFSIGNLSKSDFVAKNESGFSEGSSREIQAVAKEDQDKLLADLQKELEAKAIEELKGKLAFGQKLVEESLDTQVAEKTFGQKVGDEVDKFSLKLGIKATALSFGEDEFKQLAEVEIRNLIPSDFDYDPGRTEISFEPEDSGEKGVFAFSAHFKANLAPQFNLEEIKKNLLGKKPFIGKTYLDNLPHVVSFEVQISPKLPESIATFPRVLKNLKIKVEVE